MFTGWYSRMIDEFYYFLQQLLNGLTVGSTYALIAIGYTMVYGIIGMINFAHGEVYMIGSYVTFIALTGLAMLGLESLPLLILGAFLLSMIVTSAYGFSIERVAYRPLRGSNRLIPLISAIGMSILLQNFVRIAQGARDVAMPSMITGGISLGSDDAAASLSYMQIIIFVTTFVAMLALSIFISRSRTGRACRACAEDIKMTGLLGINSNAIIAITFVIGAALAAVAGVLLSLYYGVVNPYIGFMAGLKAFTAAVLGGIGSIPGAVLGGLVLGVTEAMTSGYFSTQYKDAVAFALLILILLFRPTGILGRPEVEKV
ncbi:L-leucine ABC transporter membrane protein /L-isoleucine ABC transporter membrane protein /L-valine ABC transporter membrane protein [Thiopseudomonas denitrificans]|uniref:L-leucine ABC transporter membrane protein /L-isoleucine ABC transporter membrane protein /L-valine ABC transporter membrane protein n=2 Tax=Thiopseudomonas denitrificans TaxID=1501432 RepID=A0A4R6U675_9GAMM|nr:L-leucine ABC transporter membrane protein /L-isoleucine ABC transporter membrane protein /L-valine ABC transporter membrane protein [Thiopseudomonas denitrificans]